MQKKQNEFLYLEIGALNIEQTKANQRLMYLQTILKRSDDEKTKKVFEYQRNNPVKGDWSEMVKRDFSNIDMTMDEELIKSESKNQYKLRLKKHMKSYM